MINSILGQVTGQLEKRFVLNALFPVLVFALALALAVAAAESGVPSAIETWEGLSAGVQVLLAIGSVGVVFLAANVLANSTQTIIMIFEGYAAPVSWFGSWGRNFQLDRAEKLWRRAEGDSEARDRFERTFPVSPRPLGREDVAPTRLGNLIRSAETYPRDRYGVDAVRLWPRLYPLIDEKIVNAMVAARTSMEFLLCVSFLAALYVPLATIYMIAMAAPNHWIFAALGAGTGISLVAYHAALGPAGTYGEQVRTAFDLNRLDLIRKLNFPVPATRAEEERTWTELALFLDRGTIGAARRYVVSEK